MLSSLISSCGDLGLCARHTCGRQALRGGAAGSAVLCCARAEFEEVGIGVPVASYGHFGRLSNIPAISGWCRLW